jgi:endonuclease YncB( thermonuclease family)
MRWIALLSGVLLLASPVHSASVLSIGDGDTITVREGSQRIKVRLACIDAPETSQSP